MIIDDHMAQAWFLNSATIVWLGLSASCGSVSSNPADASVADSTGSGSADATIDGGPTTIRSCVGLLDVCGPNGTDSCCNSPMVSGGVTFYRSYDTASDAMYSDMTNPAKVGNFRLDKYEVTVGRFRQFVNAGGGTQQTPPAAGAGAHPAIAGSGWDASWNASLTANTVALAAGVKCNATFQTWTDTVGANERRPMNCVTWYEAQAFCTWDGGFLPTETEWSYAASGGNQQRAYPWSNPPASLTVAAANASYNDMTNCNGDGQAGCALTDILFVGTKAGGDGRFGQADLGGNVWEWNLDWFTSTLPNPCDDCANLTPGTLREVRGGGYSDFVQYMRGGYHFGRAPTDRTPIIGFRCARP